MLVTVDIGNTNITIGIFDKEDLIGTYRLTTKVRRTSDEYGFMLKIFWIVLMYMKNKLMPLLFQVLFLK